MSSYREERHISFPVKYSDLGTYIYDANDKMIADVRGWGWIQKLPNPEKVQDGIGQFIVDAINEKIEREQREMVPSTTEEELQNDPQ